ncbi:hypothetical protein L1887_63512 [Cichorium endivia]|nr:hypothetical protein L1887_63512 [Cichorium endivia]
MARPSEREQRHASRSMRDHVQKTSRGNDSGAQYKTPSHRQCDQGAKEQRDGRDRLCKAIAKIISGEIPGAWSQDMESKQSSRRYGHDNGRYSRQSELSLHGLLTPRLRLG